MSLSGTRVTPLRSQRPPPPAPRLCVALGGLAVLAAAPCGWQCRAGGGLGRRPPASLVFCRLRAHLCPSREGRACALGFPSSEHTAGTWNLAGTQNLSSVSSPSRDRRGGHSTGAPGARGSVAAGCSLLPLLPVRGGLFVAPHTPQAAPTPLLAAIEQGVGPPKCAQ